MTQIRSAGENAKKLAPRRLFPDKAEQELMVASVWLHDIGYSAAREQATGLGLLAELQTIPLTTHPLHQLFVDGIDGTTGPHGETFTVDERIDEVAERYGADHRGRKQ